MKARRVWAVVICFAMLLSITAVAAAKDKEKDQESGNKVDSGTFGIYMSGRRVATETFSIQESNRGSIVTSEFKSEQGMDTALQNSVLQLNPLGEIRKYEWKSTSPEKVQATVMPNDQFLNEQVITSSQDKPIDQPFLLPTSTSILDDYFFIHREVLLWKFLATGCKQEKGQLQCPMHQRAQFGTLNPHSRSSLPITLEFSGKEKIALRGTEQEFNRFDLKSDAGNWAFWVDDQFKLIRIVIAEENTEVVRDVTP